MYKNLPYLKYRDKMVPRVMPVFLERLALRVLGEKLVPSVNEV